MIDEYICKCGNVIEVKTSHGEDFPKSVKCEKCGNSTGKRNYKNRKIIIPEEMKATHNG